MATEKKEGAPEQEKDIIDQILDALEEAGVPILDREAKRKWVSDKLEQGYTPEFILQKLRESDFNFISTGKLLDELYQNRVQSSMALEGVKQLQTRKAKEEAVKKKTSQVSLIITSFMFSGVGAFTAYIIKKSTGEMSDTGMDLTGLPGGAGSLLTNIIKAGWIIAVVGAFVGVFLIVMYLADYLKKRAIEIKKQKRIEELAKQEVSDSLGTQQEGVEQPVQQGGAEQPVQQGKAQNQ